MNIRLLLPLILIVFFTNILFAQLTPGPADPPEPCPAGSPCDNGDGTTAGGAFIGEICIVTNTNQSSGDDVLGGTGVWNCDGFCMGLDAQSSPDGVDYGNAGDGRCPNIASNAENCDGAECLFDCWWQPSNIFVTEDNGGICSTDGSDIIVNFTFRVKNPIDYCLPDDCTGIGCEVGLNLYDENVDILEVEGTDSYTVPASTTGSALGIVNTSCGIYEFEDNLTLASSGDPCTPAVYSGTVKFGKAACTNVIEYDYNFRVYEPLVEGIHYTLPNNPTSCYGSITDLCGSLEILYSVDAGSTYADTIPTLLDGICPKNVFYIIRADSLASDDCTVTGNYSLIDEVPPTVDAPADFSINFDNIPTILPCKGDFPIFAKGDFTPDDDCPFPLTTTLTSKTTANSCFEQVKYTYVALDGCENETRYEGTFIRAAVEATGMIANDDACGDNTVYTGATGGSNCYDAIPYSFTLINESDDGVVATQSSNSNGNGDVTFTGVAPDTYYVIVEDGEGCIDTTDVVDIFDPFVVTESTYDCNSNINTFTIADITGGGATHVHATDALNSTGANFPTQYTVVSSIDGALDNANPDEAYTPSQILTVGCHTITVTDGALSANCAYEFEIEIYDPMEIVVADDVCDVFNQVDVVSVVGGQTPNEACFTGADYNIYLSTTAAPSATPDVTTAIDLADVGTGIEFTDVPAGDYFAVLEDARGCQVSVPVSVADLPELTDDSAGDCTDPVNEINVTVDGGYPDYDFYYYPQGTAFDNGATAIGTDAGDGSGTDQAGNFTGVNAGYYTVYAIDAQNCVELSVDVAVYDTLVIDASVTACVYEEFDLNDITGGLDPDVFAGETYTMTISPDVNSLGSVTVDAAYLASLPSNFANYPENTYTVTVVEGRGCEATFQIETYSEIVLTNNSDACEYGSLDISVSGGQMGHGGTANINDSGYSTSSGYGLNNYTVVSDIDGNIGNPDASGNFTAENLTLGTHTITFQYNMLDLMGNELPGPVVCSETIEVEVLDSLEIFTTVNPCEYNTFTIDSINGGRDPEVFAGAIYDLILTPDPNTVGTQQWSGGAFPSFGELPVGNYDLTVTDENGCTQTETVEVYDTIAVTFNLGLGCDDGGDIDITITGGQPGHPNHSYTAYNIISSIDGNLGLANASGNFTYTGLSSGEHDFTIQYEHIDAEGSPTGIFCSEVITEVGVYEEIDVVYTVDACNAPNQLTINSITGGQDNSLGGVYTVIISLDGSNNAANDENGDPMIFTVDDTATDLPLVITDVPSASTYYIVIQDGTTDANGDLCEVSFGSIDINDSQNLNIIDQICGVNNTIQAQMLGGQAPFDYFVYPFGDALAGAPPSYSFATAVSGAAQNLSGNPMAIQYTPLAGSFNNVPAGVYTVYGVDYNQCPESSATAEAYDPFNLEIQSLVCEGQNAVEVTAVSGGRDPNVTVGGGFDGAAYTIFMSTNPAPGATNNVVTNEGTLAGVGTFTGLEPGTYYVVVEDDRGCQHSVEVEIADAVDLEQVPDECNNSANGAAVTATGGTLDWDFYLTTNGSAFDVNNPTANAVATDLGNGSGTDQTGLFLGVTAGVYTAYGIDATGCVSNPIEIAVYDSLKVEIDYNGCFFSGEVEVTAVTGGTDPNVTEGGGYAETSYTVFLSTTAAPGASNDITNDQNTLSGTGTFTGINATDDFYVVVEDERGCQYSELIEYVEQIDLTNDIADACDNGINTVQVSATGGTPGWDFYLYESGDAYDVENPSTGAVATDAASGSGDATGNFSAVASGSYFVLGVDSEGCPSDTVSVLVYDSLKVEIEVNPCYFDGQIEVTSLIGGADPAVTIGGGFNPAGYTVFLSTTAAPGGSNDITNDQSTLTDIGTFTGVEATDNFYVVVEDARGCQYSVEVEVTEQLDLVNNTSEACGVQVTEVNVSVDGGTPDWDFYLYEADFAFDENNPATGAIATDLGSGGSDQTGIFTDVDAGVYYAFGVDSEGCPADTVLVTVYDTLAMEIDLNGCFFDGELEVTSISGGADPAVTIGGGFDPAGYTVFLSTTAAPGATNNITNDQSTLTDVGTFTGIESTDNFYVVVEDTRGCQYSIEVSVIEQTTLTDETGTDCDSGINQASVSVEGGTPAWSFYLLETGSIFDAENPTSNAIATDIGSGADTQGNFTNVAAGNYTVYGLDANGCPSDSVQVLVYDSLKVEIDYNACPFDGTIEVTSVSGGTDPAVTVGGGYDATGYTIFLSTTAAPGAVENYTSNEGSLTDVGTFTGVNAGIFYVVVEDASGCQYSVEVEVAEPTELTDVTDDCAYGTISVQTTGGLPDWNFYVYPQGTDFDDANPTSGVVNDIDGSPLTGSAASAITFENVPAGDYTVFATDQSECEALSVDVTVYEEIVLEETNLCNYGELSVEATGGYSSNLTFSISPSVAPDNTTGVFSDIPDGNYTITATDDNPNGGCSVSIDLTAYDPIFVQTDQACFEGIVVTGGVPTYTYNLYTADGSTLIASNFTGIFPNTNGEYLLIIQDSNGCDNAPGVLITCEPPIECNVEATIEPTCIDEENYELSFELTTGEGTFTVTDGTTEVTGLSIGDVETFGTFANGAYTLTVTSEADTTCVTTFSGEHDCTPIPCEVTLTENVVCSPNGNFNIELTVTGEGTYTIFPQGGTPLAGAPAGTYNFGPYSAGSAFQFIAISEQDAECSDTLANTPYCCLLAPTAIVECDGPSQYNVSFTIDGLGTFTVNDGTITQTLSAGTYTVGPFPNGPYSISITSDTDETCTQTLSGDEDCYECELDLSPTITCVDNFNYTVGFSITGEGTYTIDDGINTPQTGVSAGAFTYGPYPNGVYSITVTSEVDSECTQTISDDEDCYECELEVTPTVTCLDVFTYVVSLVIAGEDIYTIDDGSGSPITGAEPGTYTFGPYENGDYSIVITSEYDENCTETVSGSQDCFECDLEASASTECIDDFTFTVNYNFTGSGTYTINDGVNEVQTGVSAGNFTVGPYNNEENYSITITNEYDETCTQTLTGTDDCYECDLEATATAICADQFTFNVEYNFSGTGTFTIDDGINEVQTGVSAGSFTVGPFLNEEIYTIIITSEEDETCSETLSGTRDCFECDLSVSQSTVCDGLLNVTASYTINGTGTFTVNDGINPEQTGVTAGTYDLGIFANETNITVNVTSEEDETCTETITITDDCFECDLELSQNTTCVDQFTFDVTYTISGSGTFTVNDGINTEQTGVTAGTYSLGNFANETSITVTVTSEEDETCNETVTITDDCFECDLEASATALCAEGTLTYNVEYTISGSGTYIIDDGINAEQTGVSAGTYTVGPFDSESNYNIVIVSEEDETCTETLSGSETCYECVLDLNPSVECTDAFTFEVTYTINGEGTYAINYGGNDTETGVIAGTYTHVFENGAYFIQVTSETDATCQAVASGELNCFECDLELIPSTNCIDDDTYNVLINISGTGTFTVSDGINAEQTGVSAGNVVVGPIPNGQYTVTVTSEEDETCFQTISGSEDCTIPCELNVTPNTICEADGNGYNLFINVQGSGTFNVYVNDELIHSNINPTNNLEVGYFVNGAYNVTVTSTTDEECTVTLSGSDDCSVPPPCDISASVNTECDEENEHYNLTLQLTGSSVYTILYNNNELSGQTAGTIDLGTFALGDYSIEIVDEILDDCSITLSGAENCEPDCDLEASVSPVCLSELTFDLEVVVEGSGLFDIIVEPGNSDKDDVEAGTYTLGDFDNDTNYTVTIVSITDSTCYQTYSGVYSCEEPCNLEVSTVADCIDDLTFNLTLTIGGTSTYSVYDNQNNVLLEELSAGTYEVGPFNNGNYAISVIDDLDDGCFQNISGIYECSVDECDINATLSPECINELTGEFNVVINLQGEGSYSITDGGNINLTGQTAGTITLGPLSSGGYSILITDEADGSCFESYSGTFSCQIEPECEVAATFLPTCLDDDTYELEMNLIGNSTYTISGSFANSPIENATSGVYTLQGMEVGFYTITIVDDNNDDCVQQYAGNYECVDSNCDLQANINYVCSDDLMTYEIMFNVSGTGNYSITASNGTNLTDQEAGLINLGDFPNGEYEIVIQDEQDLGCYRIYTGVYYCAPPPECTLDVSSIPTCVDDEFNLILEVQGESSYTIEVDGVEVVSSALAGSYTVAPNQGGYNIFIYDEFNNDCNQELQGNFSCVWTNECDLESSIYVQCINDNEFEVELTINGSGLFDVGNFFGGGQIFLQSVPEGIYTIGPFDTQSGPGGAPDFAFDVVSIFDEDCLDQFWGDYDCEPDSGCDVQVTHDKECNDDDTYNVILTIEGSGTYNIREWFDTFIGSEYENVPAGTYTVGPFDLGSLGYTSYDLVVFDANNEDNCWLNVWGDFFCELSPPCDLFATASVDCQDDGSYYLDIDLSGSDTYNLDWGFGPNNEIGNQSAGIVTIGPLTNDNYEVEITGENTDCFQTISGESGCVPVVEPCSLSVPAMPSCSADSSNYVLILTLPEGATYTINYDNGNPSDTGVNPGTYISDPFDNGAYFIEIINEDNTNCSQELQGNFTCMPSDPPCEIAFSYSYDCFNDGTYIFLFTVEGDGLFEIYTTTAGGSCNQTSYYTTNPIPAGEYTFGPYGENGCPNVTVLQQVGNPDCNRELFATASCTPECLNDIIMDAHCTGNGEFYVTVDISGDEEYSIYEWVDGGGIGNDIPTQFSGVPEGVYEVGPFTSGYDVVVYVDGNPQCFYRDYLDDFECGIECNMFASAAVECNEDELGSYDVTLTIIGSGTYNVYDPNGNDFSAINGVSAGTYVIEGMTVTNYDIYIVEIGENGEELESCYQLLEGSTNCNPTPPLCNLTANFEIVCNPNGNGSFFVDITLDGSSVYDIDFQPGPNFNNVEPGTYNYGPFNFNTFNVEITDDNDDECFQTLEGNNPCEPVDPPCDMFASGNATCVEGANYNIEITLTGTGQYTITSPDGPTLVNQTAGSITYGPISNNSYTVTITNQNNEECFQLISGVTPCVVVPCDLDASIDFVCNEDDTYTIEVTIVGDNTYTIIDNSEGEEGAGFEFTFDIDQFGNEVWWELISNGDVIYSVNPGTYQGLQTYTEIFENLNPNEEYLLVLHDTFGDGWEFQNQGGDFTVTDLASGLIVADGAFTNGSELEVFLGSPNSAGGPGSGFELTGLTAGTYNIGPFETNLYNFTVFDETNSSCNQNFEGTYSCGVPDCSVTATYELECLEDNSGFNLVLEVRGNGTYVINDGVNPPVTGVTAGFITIGPIPNGAFTVTIVDENNEECNFSISTFESCDNGTPCDISLTPSFECLEDEAGETLVELTVTIEGSGTFVVNDGQGNVTTGVEPGDFVITYNAAVANYNVTVTSTTDSDCSFNLQGSYTGCTTLPPCDINTNLDFTCLDEFTYNITLTLTGSSIYTINTGNQTFTNQLPGTIDLGTFNNGVYTITITDEANSACVKTISNPYSCSGVLPPCDLSVLTTPVCIDGEDNVFYLDVEISGSSTYSIFYNPAFFGNFAVIETALTAGTYQIGPFNEGNYFIQFVDENDDECFYNINGTYSCDGVIECDLQASVTPHCDDDELYLDIEIQGSGTYFVSVNNQFFENYPEGIYNFGPLDGDDYNVQIISNDGELAQCNLNFQGEYECDDCDLMIQSTIECDDVSNEFFVVLHIEGSDEYQVFGGPGGFQTVFGGETIEVGPFDNFYNINVIGDDGECSQNFNGNYTCNQELECNLFASAETECISNTEYNIIITITGDDEYDVTINGVNVDTDLPAGTYTFGPYTTENYFVNIFSFGGGPFGFCSQSLQGIRDCSVDAPCDLDVFATPFCEPDEFGVFYMTLEITGSSSYTINNGFFGGDPLATGVTEGEVVIGPLFSGFYSINIVDETNGDCTEVLSGNYNACDGGDCDLFVNVSTECIENSTAYNIILDVQGTGEYTLFDNSVGEVILQNITAGTYTFGPNYLANYNYSIFDDGPFENCSQFISGNDVYCVEPGPCDLGVSATPICDENNPNVYDLELDITGSNIYTIVVNGNFGIGGTQYNDVSEGTFVIEDIPEGFYTISIIDQTNNDCSKTLTGNYSCDGELECDLVATANAVCLNDNQYEIELTITGTGTYSVDLDFISQGNAFEAGTYTFGPFDTNNNGFGNFNLNVISNNFGFFGQCSQSISGNFNCEDDCTINSEIEIICNENNENFVIEITIIGGGTYDINTFGPGGNLNNIGPGTYEIGPFNDNFYFFEISNDEGCSQNYNGSFICEPIPACDLFATITPECIDGVSAYNLNVEVQGSGEYVVFAQFGIFGGQNIDTVTAGSYSYGPFTTTSYSLQLFELGQGGPFGNCFFTDSGEIVCYDPPLCDLEVDYLAYCNEDETQYFVDVTITATELQGLFTVEVADGETLTGVEQGTITVGPFPNNSTYEITVTSEESATCYNSDSNTFGCTAPPPCDLTASFNTECEPDNSGNFNLIVTIGGSGTYTINDGEGGIINNVQAGEHDLGLYVDGSYEITVTDVNNPLCNATLTVAPDCIVEPPCDLEFAVEPECVNENFFDLTIFITGSETYTVTVNVEGFNETFEDIPPGEYLLDGIPVGNYSISVVSEQTEDCFATLSGTQSCDPPPCDLVVDVNTECVDEDTFTTEIIISGTGLYDVLLDGDLVTGLDGVGAGTYDIGVLANGNYQLEVLGADDCFFSTNFEEDCSGIVTPCNLFVNADVVCDELNEGDFYLDVTIEGASNYTITYTQTGELLSFNAVAGTYQFGPFSGSTYEISVVDNEDANCNQTTGGNNICIVTPPCNVTASIDVNCDGNNALIDVTITGDGAYNIVNGINGTVYAEGVSAGITGIGPFTNITEIDIDVVNQADETCFASAASPVNCGEITCTMDASALVICNDETGDYTIELTITGEGTFTVQPGDLIGVEAGVIEIGPFDTDNYNITVTNELVENCFKNIQGPSNCDNCNFDVASEVICDEENNVFTLLVEIVGDGTFTVSDGQNPDITNQTEGFVEVGPLTVNETYQVEIVREDNPDCKQTINGVNNCVVEPPCNFDATTLINCLNEDEFEIEVIITGTGTFTIDDGANQITGLSEGSYIVGPFANGAYNVNVIAEGVANCSQPFAGNHNCTNPPCDFEINTETFCTDDETTFVLGIDIVGAGTYSISDGINPPLTGQSGYVEITLPNGAYEVTVASEGSIGCEEITGGFKDCSNLECNIAANADVACIDETSYFVDIDLLTGGSYTITNGDLTITGVGPQIVAFGPLNTSSYSIDIISDLDPNCSFNVSADNIDCSIITPTCNLGATATTECIDENGYDLTLEITGSSTYTINVTTSPNSPSTGVSAGTITLENNPVGDYQVIITDEANPDCTITLNGSNDCTGFEVCDIADLTVDAVCIGTDIELTISFVTNNIIVGNDYTINVGSFTTYNGIYTNNLVQTVQLIIPSGNQVDFVEVTVSDNEDADCVALTEFLHIYCNESAGSISNFVWEDANGDGIQNTDEIGLAQISVNLFGAGNDGVFGTSDDIQISTLTNEDGYYAFNDIEPGQYYIQVDIPNGLTATIQNAGDDTMDSDIDENGQTDIFVVNAGDNDPSFDAGLFDACANFDVSWSQDCPDEYDGTYVVVYEIADDGMVTITGDVELTVTNSYQATYNEGDSINLVFTNENGCSKQIEITPENCPALSIELLEFDGRVELQGNNLFWKTATEVDNDYFVLERSVNGVDFEKLAEINAAGNSSVTLSYSYMDYEAPTGRSYYRLQTVDFDGSVEYASNIVVLDRTASDANASISPNPVSDWLTIEYELLTETQKPKLIVYDAAGRLIDIQSLNAQIGINQHQLDMRNYSAGAYFFHLYIDSKMILTEKVIKD